MNKFAKAILFLLFFIFLSCDKENKNIGNDLEKDELIFDADYETEDFDQDNSQKESNFESGPYGINYGDTAADFTVPLEKEEWNFAENRSDEENYLFIFFRSSNSESMAIWKSDLIKLFDNTPDNTHYFFLIDGNKTVFETKFDELKNNIDKSFEIAGSQSVRKKIHIATKPVSEFNSWINDWLKNNPDFFFGIDRFQKIRKGGSFHSWESSSVDPRMEFLYKESELYNYEYDSIQYIDTVKENSVIIKGINGKKFPEEGWVKDIFFTADFPEISKGKLFIVLEQICESQKSCEWDRLQNLFLCENESSEKCEIEIGRWITTYGRSGKWITDISPLSGFFKKSGKYKFKFTVAGDQYINYLDFLLLENESDETPLQIIPLFTGTVPFDENYNKYWENKEIKIPESAKRIVISSYITGHGNGSEQENCAEFCKFESIFYVNNIPFNVLFNNAGTSRGCFDLVNQGVVPNQYGSWIFGRAGWCPGQDVKLINIDVTNKILNGKSNNFFYGALLNGKDYTPVVTDPSGYRAEIPLTSYLIIW